MFQAQHGKGNSGYKSLIVGLLALIFYVSSVPLIVGLARAMRDGRPLRIGFGKRKKFMATKAHAYLRNPLGRDSFLRTLNSRKKCRENSSKQKRESTQDLCTERAERASQDEKEKQNY